MEVIIAAIVTAVATVIVALIAKMNIGRLNKVKETVGESNGRGSVVQMNEQQLDMMERMQGEGQARDTKIKELVGAVSAMNYNMQNLSRYQNLINGVRLDFEARFEEIGRLLADLDQRLLDVEQQQAKAARFRVPHVPSRTVAKDVNGKDV